MAQLIGKERHLRRLQNLLSPDFDRRIARALYVAGQKIEIEAEKSITRGSVSGKGHVPSAPGEPPNADTHFLDRNIDTQIVSTNPPVVHVTSHAPYGMALEYGTSKMEERPYMRPAMAKHRREVIDGVVIEMKLTVQRS